MKRCYLELKRPIKDAITKQMNYCQENFIPYITIWPSSTLNSPILVCEWGHLSNNIPWEQRHAFNKAVSSHLRICSYEFLAGLQDGNNQPRLHFLHSVQQCTYSNIPNRTEARRLAVQINQMMSEQFTLFFGLREKQRIPYAL